MPRKAKPNPPKGKGRSLPELSDAVDDLETSRKIHASDIATMKWVGGIVLAIFILLSTIVIQFGIHNVRENTALRADFHALQTEFEVYKATNPPPVAIVPPIN